MEMSFKRSSDMARLPRVSTNITYPVGYTRKQKDYCKKLVSQLQESEIICDLDINLVFRYCTTKFMLDAIDLQLAQTGVSNPKEYKELLKMYTSLSTTFISLSKELGMSPRSNRLKSNIDKRQEIDTSSFSEDDSEINLEGWVFKDDED